MPDTFIRFSDMKDSHPSPIDGANDLLAISHKDINSSTGYNSMTVTPNALGAHAVEDQTFVNLETGAKTVEGAINQTLGNFANKYDATLTYAVGDCVLYAGILYKCIVAISTPEAWDSTHWEQIKAIDVGSGGGGSSADHITLTQAEYDALVQAGTVDPDAFYFISDAVLPQYWHNYSTNEQAVGTWVDGSNVYEKTIVAKNINYPTSGVEYVLGTISNSNEIIEITGTITNSAKTIKHGLPYINDTSKATVVRFNVSSSEIVLRSADTWTSLDVIVSIRYTKSTS